MVVLPLLDLVTGTGQDEKQLQEKTSGILRSRLGKNKELPSLTDTAEAEDVLTQLHARARKARSGQALAVISQCAVYLARVLEGSSSEVIASEYGKSLVDYAGRKNSPLNTSFFLDFARRLPKVAWGTRDALLAAMDDPVNFYRATQLFLVFQTLTSPVPTVRTDPSWRVWKVANAPSRISRKTRCRACGATSAKFSTRRCRKHATPIPRRNLRNSKTC